MGETLRPDDADGVLDAIRWAAAEESLLDVAGTGSKRGLGRPVAAAAVLDLSALSGIELYEPEELVMTLKAATPLSDVEAALAERGQQLDFEPPHLGPLLGGPAEGGTIGGAIACNLAGPRRIKAGAARDHLLGFHAVSGRGEPFKSGGRVVKNVTGFDLSKLMAGSFGTLAVMTSLSVRALPAPEKIRTVLVLGLDDGAAMGAMAAALGSPNEVSGAAHLPARAAARSSVLRVSGAGGSVTALRVEGPGPSVEARCLALRRLLASFGDTDELHSRNSRNLWREVRDVAPLLDPGARQVWRLSVPPSEGAAVAAAILEQAPGEVFHDWGGGLLWLALDPRPDAAHETVRGALKSGHATLIRADEAVRGAVPVFQPEAEPLAALTRRVKAGFDPRGILSPGRMT